MWQASCLRICISFHLIYIFGLASAPWMHLLWFKHLQYVSVSRRIKNYVFAARASPGLAARGHSLPVRPGIRAGTSWRRIFDAFVFPFSILWRSVTSEASRGEASQRTLKLISSARRLALGPRMPMPH